MPSTTNWWQVPGVIFNNFGASATSAGGTLIIERVNNHAASTTAQSQSSLVRRAPLVPVSNLTGVVLGRARSSDWHRCDGFCLTADKPVAEWVFGSQIISGDHARIFFAKGQVLLEDLKSKNGTFVCKGVTEFGKPLPPKLAAEAPYTLVTGDIVVLGVKMVGEPLVALRVTWVPKASPLSAFPAPCTAPVATTTGVVPMFVVDKVGSKAISDVSTTAVAPKPALPEGASSRTAPPIPLPPRPSSSSLPSRSAASLGTTEYGTRTGVFSGQSLRSFSDDVAVPLPAKWKVASSSTNTTTTKVGLVTIPASKPMAKAVAKVAKILAKTKPTAKIIEKLRRTPNKAKPVASSRLARVSKFLATLPPLPKRVDGTMTQEVKDANIEGWYVRGNDKASKSKKALRRLRYMPTESKATKRRAKQEWEEERKAAVEAEQEGREAAEMELLPAQGVAEKQNSSSTAVQPQGVLRNQSTSTAVLQTNGAADKPSSSSIAVLPTHLVKKPVSSTAAPQANGAPEKPSASKAPLRVVRLVDSPVREAPKVKKTRSSVKRVALTSDGLVAAGPAIRQVALTTDGPVSAGPAIRQVALTTDGPVSAGPAIRQVALPPVRQVELPPSGAVSANLLRGVVEHYAKMKHDMYLSHIREYAPDVDYMDTRHMHHTLDSVPHKETDTTSKHVWNSRTDTFRSRSMYMTPAELWLKIQGDKRTPANHEPIPFQLPRPRTIPGNATDKHRRLAAALWDMFHPGQPQQRAKKATKIRTITRSVIHTRTLPPTPITIDYGDLSPTTPKDAQWVDISSDDDVVIVSETPAPAVAITSRLESTVTISSASPSAYSSNYPVTPGLTPGAAHKTYPAITYPVPHIVALPTPPANHLKRTHTGHPKTQTEIIVIDSDSDNDQDNISNVADIDDNAPSSDSAPDSSSNDDGGDDDVVMEKAGKLMRGFERLKNIWTPHKDKKARVDDGETEMEDGHSMEDGAAGIGEWVSGVVGEGK